MRSATFLFLTEKLWIRYACSDLIPLCVELVRLDIMVSPPPPFLLSFLSLLSLCFSSTFDPNDNPNS